MKRIFYVILALIMATGSARLLYAAGRDNSHTAELSSATVLQTAKAYVNAKLKKKPIFNMVDPVMKTTWELYLIHFDPKTGKTGDNYYASAIFRDLNTNWVLRVVFFVGQDEGGDPEVVDVEIQDVAGKKRFTFDKNGNKVPAGKRRR